MGRSTALFIFLLVVCVLHCVSASLQSATCDRYDRGPGFIVFDEGQNKLTVIAPDGIVTVEKENPLGTTIPWFYYNDYSKRIFVCCPFKSFNMAFEDEQLFPQNPASYLSSLDGDPITQTLYYTEIGDRKVSKVGMNSMARETLGFGETSAAGGTLDMCKGVFYFGDETKIKSVNVEGDPQVIDVVEFSANTFISGMDIDAQAQKIYFCNTYKVYVYDLVTKAHNKVGETSYSCINLKVWKGFIYFIDKLDNYITKMNIDGSRTWRLHTGLFSSSNMKRLTLF